MAAREMPKTYDPEATELRLYAWWEERGYFKPETQFALGLASRDQKPFVISMPPPNVTGALHLGHAITAAIEDLMIRYHRMLGEPTLWVPGTDHAGIATQNVVERELAREGLTRHDLGREKFVERCWQWKEVYHKRITEQHRRLGVSCDWDRERFTLDEGLSRAVREAFVRLYRKGLIYRGLYMVNWCPRCESAISDLEVEPVERDAQLWTIRYPLTSEAWPGPQHPWGSGRWAEGATEFIAMSTTRPETILGDTAVAVYPKDRRYAHLVGRKAILPVLGREIPIIADEAVDPEFGTGAVKVTPAHDPNDYEMGLRHGLDAPTVLTEQGKMNDLAGPYEGLDRYECRRRIVEDFRREGLLVKVEPYRHAVGTCQRCHTDVEPRISRQWFVRVKPLAEKALAAVREGRIRIIPEREERRYYQWMENIRDWCISRQLWWGHRIPVWYCDDCSGETCDTVDPTACAHCGSTRIHQDEDVLDTWFSSGLWPFSTLGWPDETEDLAYFYPTSVLETGYDILFFWVARMIMMGIEFTGVEPFHTVYLHGIIRDERGRKISKSMGTDAYDPLKIIPRYGTDALRYTLTTSSTPGNDTNLDPRRLEGARNFANKIWNAARFVVQNLAERHPEAAPPALPDRWILSRYHRLVGEVTRLMDEYQFGEAGRQINEFLWSEFCDWYIEIAKIRLYGDDPAAAERARRTLVQVLDGTMRLLHPFMPYVTEEIWQHLREADGPEGWPDALIIAPWPKPGETDAEAEAQMVLLMDLIRGIRNVRAEFNVEAGKPIPALIAAGERLALLEAQRELLVRLARVDPQALTLVERLAEPPRQAVTVLADGVEAYLPLAGLVDLEAERARLERELERTQQEMQRVERLLGNADFVAKAPADVVAREQEKLDRYREQREKLRERLRLLTG
ncbi:MAG: valine--tRNA ligase [Anaerolineae bacterium]